MKQVALWLVVAGLILNGAYLSFYGITLPALSTLLWAGVAFANAWGILQRRQWARYTILIFALFSLASLIDTMYQSYLQGWPDYSPIKAAISFVPGTLLAVWWVSLAYVALRVLPRREA